MHKIIKNWRPAVAVSAVVSATVALSACGGGASDTAGGGGQSGADTTLTLVAYAVPEPGWSKVIPAFAATPEDQRLRLVIELTHLHPRRSERECLEALHVSRSTWFRLLRKARERVLASSASGPAPSRANRAE